MLFFLSVFFLFASVGMIGGIGTGADTASTALSGLLSGSTGVVYAFLGTRGYFRGLVAVTLIEFVAWPLADRHWLHDPGVSRAMGFGAIGATAGIVLGYVLILAFIGREGRRYFRLQTEIDLAGEIHHALAPAVDAKLGAFEFGGQSQASGKVGGDLLDLIADEEWAAYIADVSGHGVAAGVLMGVVKSAAHAYRFDGGSDQKAEGWLPALNRTLFEIMPPEKYVTFAGVRPAGAAGEALRVFVAGHPPLLHYHAATRTATAIEIENFPLGMFANPTFHSETVACEPGDVVLLYTDGITEVCNAGQEEFGQGRLAELLCTVAAQPLATAASAIIAAVCGFGVQSDDQTVLLVRRASLTRAG